MTTVGLPETAEVDSLLDGIETYIRRFVSLSESQARAVTLWVAHTQALDAADSTPYLAITSAEKQSGKTRLLEVLETLVANPWLTGRVTAAVLTRKIDAEHPTLLLDESDAAFGGEKEYAEALRGVLNTGHRRGGKASCCVGQGQNTSFRDFSTYSAKAIAGIGKLPDTVADRAIPVRLKRAAPTEKIERFRRREVETVAAGLRGRIQAWCRANNDALRDTRPKFPEGLSDRQEDGAEPLLAIADAAGGDWPQEARGALVELWTGGAAEDDSIRIRLLSDIRTVYGNRKAEKLSSADLLDGLCEIESSPWAEFNHGRPMTAVGMARLLKAFDIVPRTIKLPEGSTSTLKGYQRAWFEDAWSRYFRPQDREHIPSSHSETSPPSPCSVYASQTQLFEPSPEPQVTTAESEESPANMRVVTAVTGAGVVVGVPAGATIAPVAPRQCYIHGTAASWWERPPGSGDWLCAKCHPAP
jgi:hypothetical protein